MENQGLFISLGFVGLVAILGIGWELGKIKMALDAGKKEKNEHNG